jgi:hypothetical protein
LALWKIRPAQETVEILVGAPLFGAVRVGEVDLTPELFFHRLVVPELEPVVECDGMYGKPAKGEYHDLCDVFGIKTRYLPDDPEAGCTVNKREQGVPGVVLRAMHQVAFPVASSAALFDGPRPFAYMPLAWLPRVSTLPVRDTRLTLKSKPFFSVLPFAVNPIVYRLVA